MNWRSWASKIQYCITLYVERKCDVMSYEFERIIAEQMSQIPLRAGEEIIDSNYFMPLSKKLVAQMRTKESGRSCN
jgi:hypothetical protein